MKPAVPPAGVEVRLSAVPVHTGLLLPAATVSTSGSVMVTVSVGAGLAAIVICLLLAVYVPASQGLYRCRQAWSLPPRSNKIR